MILLAIGASSIHRRGIYGTTITPSVLVLVLSLRLLDIQNAKLHSAASLKPRRPGGRWYQLMFTTITSGAPRVL